MKSGKKVAMLVIMLFILSIAAGCGGGVTGDWWKCRR
jgi:hypothetical protein